MRACKHGGNESPRWVLNGGVGRWRAALASGWQHGDHPDRYAAHFSQHRPRQALNVQPPDRDETAPAGVSPPCRSQNTAAQSSGTDQRVRTGSLTDRQSSRDVAGQQPWHGIGTLQACRSCPRRTGGGLQLTRAQIRQEQAHNRTPAATSGSSQGAPGRPASRAHDCRVSLTRRRFCLVPGQRAPDRPPRLGFPS